MIAYIARKSKFSQSFVALLRLTNETAQKRINKREFHKLYLEECQLVKEFEIEIEGRDLFINNCAPSLFTRENAPIEVHRDYIDVQVLLEGSETQGWKPLEEIAEWRGDYDADKDVRFSDERCDHFVTLKPGELTVFYPQDGHAPAIGDGPIRKFIAKLKV